MTQTDELCNILGIPHIVTGDLVREELMSSGSLSAQLSEIVNQGKWVSDEIIISLLSKTLDPVHNREPNDNRVCHTCILLKEDRQGWSKAYRSWMGLNAGVFLIGSLDKNRKSLFDRKKRV